MNTITRSQLDLEGQAGQDVLTVYQSQINNALDTRFLTDSVAARFRSCYLDDLHAIHAIASPRRSERTAALIAADRHDGISVQLAIAGRSRGLAGNRRVVSDPDTIMILDFAQPFYMADLEQREVVNIAVPRAVLGRHVADVRTLHGMVLDPGEATMLRGLLAGLVPQIELLPGHAGPVVAAALIDLLLLALGHDPRDNRQPPADRREVLFAQARRLIDARLGSTELSPEWLVTKLGISRSDLYSLFDDSGGVARFIWRRRLDAAHRALSDPADLRRIGEIAFAYGFSSEAHFSRAYRKIYDVTPSATRRTRE